MKVYETSAQTYGTFELTGITLMTMLVIGIILIVVSVPLYWNELVHRAAVVHSMGFALTLVVVTSAMTSITSLLPWGAFTLAGGILALALALLPLRAKQPPLII